MSKKPKEIERPAVWLGAAMEGGVYIPPQGRVDQGPGEPPKPSWTPAGVNTRAMIIALGVVLAAVVLFFPVRWLQDRAVRRTALEQVRAFEKDGKIDQAFINIEAFLETWPDDIPALEFKGNLAVNQSFSSDRVYDGIMALDALLRLDPDPPARQEDRKRLAELSIRLGDLVRAGSERAKVTMDKFENRYRFANKIAEQRIKLGADDADAYRLLGLTLERLSAAGDPDAGAEAIKAFQKALRRDPANVASAEKLAELRMDRRKDQAGADQILDNLIKAAPRSTEARLARAHHLIRTGREERAKADVEAASRLDASNKGVRLTAAMLALRRGDINAAHRHLAAIPEAERKDPRVDILLAQLDLLEKRPDQAVKKIREGLLRSAGTDVELTWRLAYWLIQLDRPEDARPLMDQYRRLVGRPDHPMARLLEGLIREKAGRHASAVVELEPAREEINAEWRGELEMIIGRCHEFLGDLEAAETAFGRARDASPAATSPRQALARMLMKVDPDRAINELVEAIRVAPAAAMLQGELASAQVVRQLALPAERRDWNIPLASVDKGLRAKPDDPGLILTKARVLAAAGRADQAETTYKEATEGACRTKVDVWLARAQFLESRGRPAEALVVLDQASKPVAVGDIAPLRVARSGVLSRTGHGRMALGLLAVEIQKFSTVDRANLARQKANLLAALGDRKGARLACQEWAGLAPEDPGPGLTLLDMSRRGGSSEEQEEGIAILRKVGGENEPISLSAQALAILAPGANGEAASTRLEEAEALSSRLQDVAPKLPITSLIRAMILEQGSDFEEAIAAYKLAIKGDSTGMALPRLVALLTRLKREDDLNTLKSKTSSASTAIDRITLGETLGSGDKVQAEALLSKLIEADPDSLEYRADLARVLRDVGRPEQAELTLTELVERRPERPQPWLALLALQLERGDRTSALVTVERLKKEYKGERLGLLLIRCFWALGDRAEAAKVCEAELAAKPDDMGLLQLNSEIEEANGRGDLAEVLINRALAINPELRWARRRMALILSGRPNHARWADARKLVEPDPSGTVDTPQDRMIRATVLERGPDVSSITEAIEVYRSLAEDLPFANPIGRKARFSLSKILLARGDRAGAAEVIVPVTADSASPDPNMLALAIEALSLEGKAEESRLLLDRLAKAEPDAPPTIACRALVLKAEGDLEAACTVLIEAAAAAETTPEAERLNRFYFDQLTQIGTESVVELFGRKMVAKWPTQGSALARYFAGLGRLSDALDAGLLAVNSGQPREMLRMLLSLQALGRLEGPLLDRATNLAIEGAFHVPKASDVLAMTTAFLRKIRRFDDEAVLYRKILDTEPTNVVARNNLAWVLGHDLNKPAEALVEVDKVIAQLGPIPQATDTRGMVLAKLGRIDEAITDLERATKADPSAIHHIHLARAYAQAGRTGDRQRSLEAARVAAARPGVLEPEDLADLDIAKPH